VQCNWNIWNQQFHLIFVGYSLLVFGCFMTIFGHIQRMRWLKNPKISIFTVSFIHPTHKTLRLQGSMYEI
jgi:hypothetical protein